MSNQMKWMQDAATTRLAFSDILIRFTPE